MSRETKRITLIVILVNLAALGLVGYAIEHMGPPVGVLFLTSAGPVAFNHQGHVRHGGEGLNCENCHHEVLSLNSSEKNCRACHYYGKEPFHNASEKVHKRCIGAKCMSCHADKACAYCHSP